MKVLLRAAFGLERNGQGNQSGPSPSVPGDRRRAILLDDANDLPRYGNLRRAGEARQHGDHVGARHRETRRAETVERMAERVDTVAIDFGDRAGGAEVQVAVQ